MNVCNFQNTLNRAFLISKINCPRPQLTFSRSSSQKTSELPASFADDEPTEEVKKPPEFFNKSRLLPQDRKVLHEKQPYDEPHSWIHLTERYQRKMFGRYGLASNVDPRICFPTKEDIKLREEYESVAFPVTLKEMIEKVKVEKEAKRLEIKKREDEIAKKIEKLEQWKADLRAKIAKKEADAIAAKEKKERLVEEVRRHFGFKMDPKDERFKELLEKKEKEDRKKQKEAKRKAKEEKMMSKLLDKTKEKAEIVEE